MERGGTRGGTKGERAVPSRGQPHEYIHTNVWVDLLDAAWGLPVCGVMVSFTWVCRDGIWFGFTRFALLLAVIRCWGDLVLVPACCWAYSALSV